jgi:hypothetical protein
MPFAGGVRRRAAHAGQAEPELHALARKHSGLAADWPEATGQKRQEPARRSGQAAGFSHFFSMTTDRAETGGFRLSVRDV